MSEKSDYRRARGVLAGIFDKPAEVVIARWRATQDYLIGFDGNPECPWCNGSGQRPLAADGPMCGVMGVCHHCGGSGEGE